MTSQPPILRVRGVSKTFPSGAGGISALDDVTLELHAGEFLVVMGPSGSGKTTLLHCLSGLLTPDAGEVRLGDTDLTGLDDDARSDLRRDSMGFVFQRLNLLPALDVAENVQLPLVLRGGDRNAIETRTRDILDLVGLADRAHDRPDTLSGGQAQLVALGRALAPEPEIVWADEPTGQLDRDAAGIVLDRFAAVTATGSAVVVVTHDPDVAARGDRVVELVDGRLAQ